MTTAEDAFVKSPVGETIMPASGSMEARRHAMPHIRLIRDR